MPDIKFKLKDRYTVMLWNPSVLGVENVKAINAFYIFSVLFSAHAEKSSTNKSVSEYAHKICSKFTSDIASFDKHINLLIRACEKDLKESVFSVSFDSNQGDEIVFSTEKNKGVCPENAALLRSVIKLDEYVFMLNQLKSMTLIHENDFYRKRKLAQEKLRSILESYNSLIKRFHSERKKLLNK